MLRCAWLPLFGVLLWPYDTAALSSWHLWLLIKVAPLQLKLSLPVRSFPSFFKKLLQVTISVSFFFSETTKVSGEGKEELILPAAEV